MTTQCVVRAAERPSCNETLNDPEVLQIKTKQMATIR